VSHEVRMRVPTEFVGTWSELMIAGRRVGPAAEAFPSRTHLKLKDEKKRWEVPYLFIGASRRLAKELELARLDDLRATEAVRRVLLRERDSRTADCRPVDEDGFHQGDYRGYEKHWVACGPRKTGRLREVVAFYTEDRSVVVVFRFFQPRPDDALEAAGQTALQTFTVNRERISRWRPTARGASPGGGPRERSPPRRRA
jgi:hypothetical protein